MKRIPSLLFLCGVLLFAQSLRADTIFTATLNGAQEPTASTATGFGTVILNTAETFITVDESWVALIGGPATATHIHCCAGLGVNAPVLFPFSGVPNVTSGSIPAQTFAITAAQVLDLEAGLKYFNVHDGQFPGGEIRGQILPATVSTPEPSSLALLLVSLIFVLIISTKKRAAHLFS